MQSQYPLFLSARKNLLTSEEDVKRLNDVWEWSRSIKKKNVPTADMSCVFCKKGLAENDQMERCYNCKSVVHGACLHTNNTGWSENDDKYYCSQCTLFILVCRVQFSTKPI